MSLPLTVLWIDPGGMTGLAALSGRGRSFWCDEYPFGTACANIEESCRVYGREQWIGWEQFIIGSRTPARDAHRAIEVIGAARYLAGKYGCQVLPAATPDQRKVASKPMLEAVGWWRPGKDDAQSAAQHMLAWLLRTGTVPSELAVTLSAARQH